MALSARARQIEAVIAGVQSQSWVDPSIGRLVQSLDPLSAPDPLDALSGWNVPWLESQLQPLRTAWSWTSGNQAGIIGHNNRLTEVATAIGNAGADLQKAVQLDLVLWQGDAAESYRSRAAGTDQSIAELTRGTQAVSLVVQSAGLMVATTRASVRDQLVPFVEAVSRAMPQWQAEIAANGGAGQAKVNAALGELVRQTYADIVVRVNGMTSSATRLAGLLDDLNGAMTASAAPPQGTISRADQLWQRIQRARARGDDPRTYKHLLQEYYILRAAGRAGIDMSTWDPSKGAVALQSTIKKVYTYYGRLYLDHPELQWAGMANMIGPTFAGGMLDLGSIREVAAAANRMPMVHPPTPLDPLTQLTEKEVSFYETTFTGMQKEIFEDQGMMHEAYLSGGMPAINELHSAGIIDDGTQKAWADIDQGARENNKNLLARGNTTLLYREQHDIIQDDYQRMFDHSPTGPAFTYAMTTVGEASIPGARTFAQFKPLTITMETPGPKILPIIGDNPLQGTVTVQTPLPSGNVTTFDTRWELLSKDTVPAYQRLITEHPEQARQIISTDVGTRIEQYRMSNSVGRTVQRLSDFHVSVKQ